MPACGARQADRRDAERVERHRDERRALVLAGREEDVELAGIGLVGDGRGERQQLVRRVAHRRHDDDQLRPARALAHDPPRDPLDALGACDGRAAELHHDEGSGHAPHSSGGSRSSRAIGRSAARSSPSRRSRGPPLFAEPPYLARADRSTAVVSCSIGAGIVSKVRVTRPRGGPYPTLSRGRSDRRPRGGPLRQRARAVAAHGAGVWQCLRRCAQHGYGRRTRHCGDAGTPIASASPSGADLT